MKQGLKKALVMLLSVAMVFTFMAMPVYADDFTEAEANEVILDAPEAEAAPAAEEAEQIAEPEAEVQEELPAEEEPAPEAVQEEAPEVTVETAEPEAQEEAAPEVVQEEASYAAVETAGAKADDQTGETVTLADGTYNATGLSTAVLNMYHFHDAKVVVKGDNAWLITTEDTDKTVKRFDGMAYGPQSQILDPTDDTNHTLVEGTATATVVPVYDEEGTLVTRTFVLPVPKSVFESNADIYYMIKYVAGYDDTHDGDWYKANGGDYYLTGYTLEWESDSTALPGEEPAAEPIELAITNNTGMFKAVTATAVGNDDGSAVLTFALSSDGYKWIYKGTYEDALAAKDDIATGINAGEASGNLIKGYLNDEGKWEFQMNIAASEIGKTVPVVSISESKYNNFVAGTAPIEKSYYPRQFLLDLDEGTLVTGDYDMNYEFTLTTALDDFKAASPVSVHIVGGPNSNNYKVEPTLVMNDGTYDKVTFPSAEDPREAELNDGKFVISMINKQGNAAFQDKTPLTFTFHVAESAPYEEAGTDVERTVTFDQFAKTITVEGTALTPKEIIEPAEPAEVTFTLSNKGLLASAKDGTAVVEKPVTVTDLDEDGHLTYDEALVAAHNAYFEGGAEAGYATGDPYGSGSSMVTKLWGIEATNTLFMTNDEGIPSGVMMDEVKAGDSLYASINADAAYYADWYTKFGEKDIEATTADNITVTLTGHLGMAYKDEDKEFVPLEGIQIGVWKDGAFEAIEGAVTDANGKAVFKLAAGEYILTAKGTVKDEVQDWSTGQAQTVTADCPIMAPYANLTVKQGVEPTYTAGEYIVGVHSIKLASGDAYSMFTPRYNGVDKTALVTVAEDGSATIFFDNNRNTYNAIFLGEPDNLGKAPTEEQKASASYITTKTTGTAAPFEFEFAFDTANLGKTVPYVTVSRSNGKFNATQLAFVFDKTMMSKASFEVVGLIDALPAAADVTVRDKDAIEAARAAYDALTETQKAEVTNLDKLVAAEEAYAALPEKDEATIAVETAMGTLIQQYYDVNDTTAAAVADTRAAYDALTLQQKAYIEDSALFKLYRAEACVAFANDGIAEGTIYDMAVDTSDNSPFIAATISPRSNAAYVYLYSVAGQYNNAALVSGTVSKSTHSLVGNNKSVLKGLWQVKTTEGQGRTFVIHLTGANGNSDDYTVKVPGVYGVMAAGTYQVEAVQTPSSAMRKFQRSTITSDGTAMTVEFVMPNTTYGKIFLGTKEAAAAATEGFIEPTGTEATSSTTGTGNVYSIPLESMYSPIVISYCNTSKNTWTQETVEFKADEQAQAVIDAIAALNLDTYFNVTADQREQVTAANELYQALNDSQKAIVENSNYSTLKKVVAMFQIADIVAAEIEALPAAENVTKADVDTIRKVKADFDNMGKSDIIKEALGQKPDGTWNTLQNSQIEKLISQEMRDKLNACVKALADYSAVDAALEKVPKDLSIYTEDSAKALTDAANAVVRDKLASEQTEVDAMAKAIEDAFKGLVVIPQEVTFTLSNKGSFVTDKDGNLVVERPVTVTDLNDDKNLTYDEALIIAHNSFYEGGAEAGYDAGSGMVKKVWGVSSTNLLFMRNDEGLPTGATVDTVKEGDVLYVSINADDTFYSDWYTKFSESKIETTSADDITVTLTGHLGMAYLEEDKQFVPLEGIQIGVWKDGAFEAIDGAVTDKDGKATFRMAAGEYLLTAQGSVEGVVTDYTLQCDATLYGTTGYVKYGEEYDSGFAVGYTETDHGNGPYPIDEVKWVDWMDWFAEGEDFEGYLLYSNQFIAGCPIMAPYANLTVTKTTIPADYTVVDTALAKVPTDLSIYTEETAQAVTDAVNAVDRTKMVDEQEAVNAMAQAIETAVAGLEMKPADYSAVNAALAKVPEDLSIYTEETAKAVADAVAAVVEGKNITEQSEVDAMAKAINDAVAGLVEKADQEITATVAAAKGIVSVGKSTTINVEGAIGEVTYKPLKEGIVTVDENGKVTAKKVGTVQIEVTAAGDGNYKEATKTVKVYVVPGATTSVTASNLATGMKVNWKKVTGATGYKVYRNGKLVATIKSGSTVTYTDKEANTNGTKYTFKVVATASTGTSKLSKSLVTYRVSRPAISSVKNSSAKVMKVTWGKNSKATGYEIMYSTSKSFASGNKTVTVGSASTVSRGIGGLTKGKTYYVKMRTYKTVSGKKYYSAWSVVKSVKITK